MLDYVWIAMGGARYALNGVVSVKFGESFPFGTLAVNVAGSLLIGGLGALVIPEGRMSAEARAFTTQFLMIGICGGFTTFSSFSLQTLNLVREGEWLHAGGNVLLSVTLCLVATWLGYMLATAITSVKGP